MSVPIAAIALKIKMKLSGIKTPFIYAVTLGLALHYRAMLQHFIIQAYDRAKRIPVGSVEKTFLAQE